VFKTLKDRLVMWLVPALTKLGEWVEKGLKAFKEFDKDTQILENSMKIFGLFLIVVLIPALWTAVTAVYALLAPFLAVAAVVAAAFLVVEDLYALFTGGDSAIGHYLDEWFGEGSAQKVIDWGANVVKTFKEWIAAFPNFTEWEDRINSFFGRLFGYLNQLTWQQFWDGAKAAGQAFLDWALTIPEKIASAFSFLGKALKYVPGFGGFGGDVDLGKGGRSGGAGAKGPNTSELPPVGDLASHEPPKPPVQGIGGNAPNTVEQIQNLLGNVQASARPPMLAAPAPKAGNSTENNVTIGPTTVNVQNAPGTPAKQAVATGKKVAEVVDNRNRQALQALEFGK
jgi:hypothetical protein